jgi:2-amino-4-hydroxy-6-hydroxymethyldihydropteridine diphosphokinase
MIPDSPTETPDSFAYVGLGSNIGDRAGTLLLAVRGMLEAGFVVTRLSPIYETEPVGGVDQPMFLNMVAEIHPGIFSPEQILARLLRIEYALGRRREIEQGPRTIDLDLLLVGEEQRSSEFLQLPHPRMHQRRFVLTPLAELAPQLIHPVLRGSIAKLLATTEDQSAVRRWEPRIA